jgi:hypothetical protein
VDTPHLAGLTMAIYILGLILGFAAGWLIFRRLPD